MDLKEKTIKKDYVYRGLILNVRKDEAETADGQRVPREVVEHPGGVGIAMEDDEGKFFMVTQYRYAQEKVMTEYPAGKREPGETGEEALIRECREELAVTVRPENVFMVVDHVYPDLHVQLTLYNAVITEDVPELLEHCDLKWITVSEIPDYEFCPADRDILQKLTETET